MFKNYVNWVDEYFYGSKVEDKHPIIFGIIYVIVIGFVIYKFIVD